MGWGMHSKQQFQDVPPGLIVQVLYPIEPTLLLKKENYLVTYCHVLIKVLQ